MDGLIGHTGFVGGNLASQKEFAARYNSKNIDEIFGKKFETLVVSGAPGAMWMGNKEPEADRQNIRRMFDCLESVEVHRVVLISTIAVYRDPSLGQDERNSDFETVLGYGRNRRELECLFQERFANCLIVRLPALFGVGLKKNFIFDVLNPVPSFLKPELFNGLLEAAEGRKKELLRRAFRKNSDTGMFHFDRAEFSSGPEAEVLKAICHRTGTTSLVFTNAKSQYQFYDLSRLWSDIEIAFELGVNLMNLVTAPVSAGEIFFTLTGEEMDAGEAQPVVQDLRSAHASHWGSKSGYLCSRDEVLAGIKEFAEGQI